MRLDYSNGLESKVCPRCFQVNHGTCANVEATVEEPRDRALRLQGDTCTPGTSTGGKYHSDCYNLVNGSFEEVLSLALGFAPNHPVSLWDILASKDQRMTLYRLLPLERCRLRDAIEQKYRYLEKQLLHTGQDTMALQTEYEIASYLITPIHQLPVELIELVFSLIPDEQNEKFRTLERTCRRWKEIVLSLWSPLKLATWTPLDKVQPIVNRAHGLLSVTIDPSSDALDCPIDSLETERYVALLLAMSTGISRWRSLDILSIPNPQHMDGLLGELSHAIHPVPMNHLRYLNIPIRHNSSRFLDRLLPSIGATTSVYLTKMHLCSAQTILYLAQSHCAKVFNYITSFKCLLPRTHGVIDILPHFSQLAILEASGLQFPTYPVEIELPLAKTLRQMSLRAVPIGWMNSREFSRLESCRIVSPPALDLFPATHLPVCTTVYFESPRFDAFRKFRIAPLCTVTLRSPQWSELRGNVQLSQLWGAVPREGLLRPTTLHLQLACSTGQLVQALCSMLELKELMLELDRPTVLGRHFFMRLLPQSLRIRWRYKQAKLQLQVCPSLRLLRLKYRRWFRPGESNDMAALLTVAYFDERTPRLRIWVEKGIPDQVRVQVDGAHISASILQSLGLLRFVNGGQPPGQVAEEVVEALRANLTPMGTKFYYAKVVALFSPSVYSSLFRRLQNFTLIGDIDQRVLCEALAHFEHLETLYLMRLIPLSSQPHLPLLRTLKKMQLGTTSLLWMGRCNFLKLEELVIGNIQEGADDQFQCVQMPVCKFASLPQRFSPTLLRAFQMPQLHNLDLHNPVGLPAGLHYPPTQQFRLHTATLYFVNAVGLQDICSIQPELEVLEIRDVRSYEGFQELLNILMEPLKMNGSGSLDHGDHGMGLPRQRLPRLCPKLKDLKLKLKLELEASLLQELLQKRQLEQELIREMVLKKQPGLNQVIMHAHARAHELEQMLIPGWVRGKVREELRNREQEPGLEQELVLDWVHKKKKKLERKQELMIELRRKLKLVSTVCQRIHAIH
jgi:hypothetical protein